MIRAFLFILFTLILTGWLANHDIEKCIEANKVSEATCLTIMG